MICYKDQTYCASKVKKHICGREFTKQDAVDAEKWWGSKGYPVAYSEFCVPDAAKAVRRTHKDTNLVSEGEIQ